MQRIFNRRFVATTIGVVGVVLATAVPVNAQSSSGTVTLNVSVAIRSIVVSSSTTTFVCDAIGTSAMDLPTGSQPNDECRLVWNLGLPGTASYPISVSNTGVDTHLTFTSSKLISTTPAVSFNVCDSLTTSSVHCGGAEVLGTGGAHHYPNATQFAPLMGLFGDPNEQIMSESPVSACCVLPETQVARFRTRFTGPSANPGGATALVQTITFIAVP
jgi:hypothetical protein